MKQALAILVNIPSSHYAMTEVIKSGDVKACIEIAQNPETPVAILQQLSQSTDISIRGLVAKNLRLPLESLLNLAQDPNITVRSWLTHRRHPLPIEVLELLALDQDSSVRMKVAENLNTPAEILTTLVTDNDSKIVIAALRNSNTPEEILAEHIQQINDTQQLEHILLRNNFNRSYQNSSPILAEILSQLAQHDSHKIRFLVARHLKTSPQTLSQLALDSHNSVSQMIAENPNTTAATLIEMAKQDLPKNISVYNTGSYKIASRQDSPPEALDALATKGIFSIQLLVAANKNTSYSTLEWLIANAPDDNILISLARHPNITSRLGEQLAEHPSLMLKKALAANTKVSLKLLTKLAQSSDTSLREVVAQNTSISVELLTQLAEDVSLDVQNAVFKNVNTPDDIKKRLSQKLINPIPFEPSNTLKGLSRIYDPKTDYLPSLLTEYTQSLSPFVRFVSLMHPLTPLEVLADAAKSLFWLDRYAVAKNSATVETIKQQLALDSNAVVRATAKGNLS